jgi:hypothetical protein
MISAAAERALVIKAKGGLGNRMLSGVTGLVLADLNNRTGYIDWRDGMYLEPGANLYPLLFDAGWMDDLGALDHETDVAPKIWNGRLTDQPIDIIRRHFPNQHQNPVLYRKLSISLTGRDCDARAGVFWSYLPKMERLKPRLARDPRFAGKSADTIMHEYLSRYFQPVGPVRDKVERVFSGIQGPVIGVHIRFTDRKVPLEKIISKLNRLRAEVPQATIFLATDSAEAQEAILARFANVVTIDKALAKDGAALHFSTDTFVDPVEEARNALVDMVALARCDWLLHSRHSTFSVTAALIGNIPEHRQIDVDKYNPKVRLKQFFQARV